MLILSWCCTYLRPILVVKGGDLLRTFLTQMVHIDALTLINLAWYKVGATHFTLTAESQSVGASLGWARYILREMHLVRIAKITCGKETSLSYLLWKYRRGLSILTQNNSSPLKLCYVSCSHSPRPAWKLHHGTCKCEIESPLQY
jgi:hypothetical protein